MSAIQTEFKGFTPVIDSMVKEVGLMPAVTYGIVWRFCQMKDGVCKASLETLAEKVGVSRRTIYTHIKQLCDAGYLKDLTPDLRNAPHVYADTRKARIGGTIEADEGMQEIPTDGDGMQEIPTGYAGDSHQGMQEIPMSILSEDTKDTTTCADSGESDTTRSGQGGRGGGYSSVHREFLGLFGAKRFKNRIQVETIEQLENRHGKERLMELGVWAAKNGMSVSRAVVAVEGALKKQANNGRGKPIKVSVI